jgi:hypothetical protein
LRLCSARRRLDRFRIARRAPPAMCTLSARRVHHAQADRVRPFRV